VSAACARQGPAAARHAVLAPGAARVRGRACHRLRRAGLLPARARRGVAVHVVLSPLVSQRISNPLAGEPLLISRAPRQLEDGRT